MRFFAREATWIDFSVPYRDIYWVNLQNFFSLCLVFLFGIIGYDRFLHSTVLPLKLLSLGLNFAISISIAVLILGRFRVYVQITEKTLIVRNPVRKHYILVQNVGKVTTSEWGLSSEPATRLHFYDSEGNYRRMRIPALRGTRAYLLHEAVRQAQTDERDSQ